jgi:nucleotide-binding universal stress UspA family protein
MTAPTRLRNAQRPAKSLGIHRLVVGTDFSADGNRAIRRAATLSLAPRARLLLVHVLPASLDRAVLSLATGAAEIELESQAERLRLALRARRRDDVTVTARVVRGNPSDVIERLAQRFAAELIVVGRRGQSRIRELILGTTARRLLRRGRLPVLVVGRPALSVYRTAIVGFDFSPESLRAARLTRHLVPYTASLLAVHACEDPYRGLPPSLIPDRTRRLKEVLVGRNPLVRKAIATTGRGATPWQILIREGDPRQVLLETARARRADLIAVGSAGRSGVPRMVLGSVAEAVLERAPCDVLLVRRKPRPR